MSELIKHECGIALIRLLKPLEYYADKYGSPLYGLNKLYLLMEKMHNRGQDGVGVASIKMDMPPGTTYIDRVRSIKSQPIKRAFGQIFEKFEKAQRKNPDKFKDPAWLKNNVAFFGEVLMGHLRYGTHGKNSISTCHPFLRRNNWKTRNLAVAGNFNMTNVQELFQQLVELGQHPKEKNDTITVLEKIGHFLDTQVQYIFNKYKDQGRSNEEITNLIMDDLNLQQILSRAAKDFDGGYVMAGMLGHGDSFIMRDGHGIRPAFWYHDDEVLVAASERPAIQTTFNVPVDSIQEVSPGHAVIIKRDGSFSEEPCVPVGKKLSCSFERIYFSRGTDIDIYSERKNLGYQLTSSVLEAVDQDIENTVFSFIPNTAEVAFYGLVKGVEDRLNEIKADRLVNLENKDKAAIERVLALRPRVEKVAVKDVKLRTFITEDSARDEMVSHVYDITYGSVVNGSDHLVVIDDSIVRGTTLEKSILKILDRLSPKKIIVVSSAPQIRYPDCYGIDMSKIGEFIAFRAAIKLLKDRGMESVIDETAEKCREAEKNGTLHEENFVKAIYAPFTYDEVSEAISAIAKPEGISCDVQILYQTVEGLHKACPDHLGDWYFTGDFPTPGGLKVVNKAFLNYYEGKNVRAY